MDRENTLALFLEGREAWNAWAERMLDERKTLENTGRWAAQKAFDRIEPLNGETAEWIKKGQHRFFQLPLRCP